jgi:hypothetical protein
VVLRVEGRVFYDNTKLTGQKLRPLIDEASPKVVVLDTSAVFDLEYRSSRG